MAEQKELLSSKKRKEIEDLIYKVFDTVDTTKTNSDYYRELFSITQDKKRKQRCTRMTLKEGQNHHSYRVLSMDLDLALERRLEALGLTEGTVITILNNDKKGSLTARFRGTRFALGRRIADHIQVREA